MNSTQRFPLDSTQYQLIDFGGDEKLEMFGGKILRRDTPSGFGVRDTSADWNVAQLRYRSNRNGSCWTGQAHPDWHFRFGNSRLELRLTPTGQVGVFPEQAFNWSWINQLPVELSGMKALNLFAYTGGTTLALAQRGASVVHCDAAKSVVNWARSNATASGLSDAPIRWIVEDALKFVRREIKRGNEYQIIVADPPSFGRGPSGESWKMQRDFEPLVESLAELTGNGAKMILLSCHTPEFNHNDLASAASRWFNLGSGRGESFELKIPSANKKSLLCGQCFRWFSES